VWSGPRAVGDTVTVRYKVRIKAIKDGDAKNYAYATTDPVKPGSTPPSPCAAPACASTSTAVTEVITGPVPAPAVTKSVTGWIRGPTARRTPATP
jgi:hypothetical protein